MATGQGVLRGTCGRTEQEEAQNGFPQESMVGEERLSNPKGLDQCLNKNIGWEWVGKESSLISLHFRGKSWQWQQQ